MAEESTNSLSSAIRGIGFIALLKLLYKQKIKPSTAILLIATYSFNADETNRVIYNAFKDGFKKMYTVENEKEQEIKSMGFDYKS